MTLLVLIGIGLAAWVAREHRFIDYSAWPENFRANVDYSWTKPAPGNSLPDAVANTMCRVGYLVAAVLALVLSLRTRKFAPVFAFYSHRLSPYVSSSSSGTDGMGP